jgi:hypothetical protein
MVTKVTKGRRARSTSVLNGAHCENLYCDNCGASLSVDTRYFEGYVAGADRFSAFVPCCIDPHFFWVTRSFQGKA